MTLVSFVIPTLNRGVYVLRAVKSCLAAAHEAGVGAEVIVLDSQSDDGSWEALEECFGGDPAVRLVQNQRGLGPTHSWLDGAALVTGDFATFIWSDDYVAPHFLTRLLPVTANSTVAVGRGAIRDIDDASPIRDDNATFTLSGVEALEGYLGAHPMMTDPPVSPAAALFRRDAFDHWRATIERSCRQTELRQQLMWRRAIGPDLLLYIDALRHAGDQKVTFSGSEVVQFSVHGDSITIGSPPWLIRAGYWLSRTTAILDLHVLDRLPKPLAGRLCARVMLQGYALARKPPVGQNGLEPVSRVQAMVREEVNRVGATLAAEQGRLGFVRGWTQMAWHEARRQLVRAAKPKAR